MKTSRIAAYLMFGLCAALLIGVSGLVGAQMQRDQYGAGADQSGVGPGTSSAPATSAAPGYQTETAPSTMSSPQSMSVNRWNYDPAREIRISGTVVEPLSRRRGAGEMLTLRTASGEIRRVQLGPAWYLKEIGFSPKVGDSVRIVGMPEVSGPGTMLARQVMWKEREFTLRSSDGMPAWSARGDRRGMEYSRLWNPSRRAEITGTIEKVGYYAPAGRNMGEGVELVIKPYTRALMPGEKRPTLHTVTTQLGPAWYVEQNLPDLRRGQQVTIGGSWVTMGRHEILMASSLRREQQTVQLRNAQGMPAWAGGWTNWGGWGAETPYARFYNPSMVRTISGRIEAVNNHVPMARMGEGVMLRVRTADRQVVKAQLGPSWFVEENNLMPRRGEEVSLTGAMVNIEGRPVMIVREMNIGSERFVLRDQSGMPLWAGRPSGLVVGSATGSMSNQR